MYHSNPTQTGTDPHSKISMTLGLHISCLSPSYILPEQLLAYPNVITKQNMRERCSASVADRSSNSDAGPSYSQNSLEYSKIPYFLIFGVVTTNFSNYGYCQYTTHYMANLDITIHAIYNITSISNTSNQYIDISTI